MATPTDDSLDLNLVADTRLSVTVATDETATGDRVGSLLGGEPVATT